MFNCLSVFVYISMCMHVCLHMHASVHNMRWASAAVPAKRSHPKLKLGTPKAQAVGTVCCLPPLLGVGGAGGGAGAADKRGGRYAHR